MKKEIFEDSYFNCDQQGCKKKCVATHCPVCKEYNACGCVCFSCFVHKTQSAHKKTFKK